MDGFVHKYYFDYFKNVSFMYNLEYFNFKYSYLHFFHGAKLHVAFNFNHWPCRPVEFKGQEPPTSYP